ncbi:MAG: hypothetical protein V7641_2619 [Blastocatellia bacterium]
MLLRRTIVALLCISVVLTLPYTIDGQEGAVKIEAVVQTHRTHDRTVIYKVNYSYEFKGLDSVYIEGFGSVPAKGRFTYFTEDSNIRFKESAQGRILTVISLLGSEVNTSSTTEADFPEESQFTLTYRSGLWPYSSSFQKAINKVINQSFPSGYKAFEANNINYYQTTYVSLRDLPENLIAEIAVLFSHPYEVKARQFAFHIQFVAREKRVQSGRWRYELSQETQTSSERFIDEFIKKLSEEGKKNK